MINLIGLKSINDDVELKHKNLLVEKNRKRLDLYGKNFS